MPIRDEIRQRLSDLHADWVENEIAGEKSRREVPPEQEAEIRACFSDSASLYHERDREEATQEAIMDAIDAITARLDALTSSP